MRGHQTRRSQTRGHHAPTRRIPAWMGGCGLWLAMALAVMPAEAQPMPQSGWTERRGGTLRRYDPWGTYEGRSQRSTSGQVLRHYDADGRYLGREEINRDFRRRRPGQPAWGANGQGEAGPGPQIYVDPGMMQPPPEMHPDFPPSRGTPWFNDRNRR